MVPCKRGLRESLALPNSVPNTINAMKMSGLLIALFLPALCLNTASASVLVNGANQTGIIFTNTVADSYTFTANTGDSINLRLGTTNFGGKLRLYGPNAALLRAVGSYPVNDDLIAYTATNSGTFTVLVSSYDRATAALTRCIWLRFLRPSLCRRVMKAAP